MKAAIRRRYGSPDVLEVIDLPIPTPTADQVLVKVTAASLNSLDWRQMRGEPYLVRVQGGLTRPREIGLGADVAGTVVSVGENVTDFEPGDAVFGQSIRTLAEYVVVSKTGLASKPQHLDDAQAAAIPLAGLTALQGLARGGLTAGQRVLITGASGGVGHFAVQIAAAYGAIVTASCRTEHRGMVEKLGASSVRDYTRENIASGEYDLVFEAAGNLTIGQLKRMAPVVVLAGAPHGTMKPLVKPLVTAGSKQFISYLERRDIDDLRRIGSLVTPVIDSRFGMHEIAAAMRHFESGHPGGKVIIDVA